VRVAITGASGLLGANVAAAAVDDGHEVICTRRAGSRSDAVQDLVDRGAIRWVDAPLSDPDALARAFEGCELVLHCAASTSVLPRPTPELIASNVEGTRHVLAAVRAASVRRLVHTSSTVTVGIASDPARPCTEAHEWNLARYGLDDGYATTKRQSEELVLAAVRDGLDAVVVNPGFLFGPRDARPSSGTMILEVASGRARLASSGRNCFVDVRDVARGLLLAAERGQKGERYILGGENLSYLEVFTRIAAVVGASRPLGVAPRPLARAMGLLGDVAMGVTGREMPVTTLTVRWGYTPGFVFSSEKARTALGYTTRPLEEGISAAWAWFATHRRSP
jgi:dihydroflavonol-4-reductase